jgi:hypothetical protein
MHLPSTSRPTRVRRLLAVSAAAAAVMIAPTACDYGGYGNGSSAGNTKMGDMGDMPGMDHHGGARNPEQQPVVVPVGNTVQATPEPAAGETTATRTPRRRDGRRYWRSGHPTQATVPPPTTDPATPPVDGGVTDTATPPVTDTTSPAPTDPTTAPPTAAPAANSVGPGGADGNNNGLDVLGRDCTKSTLAPHDGFQKSPACVNTEMGEVAAEDKLPSLLITDAPKTVGVNQPFTLKVSTRNLIRDRFLGAKAGGYYLESSFLDPATGLQRGHFHTACRILSSLTEAPDSSKAPEFFVATEDKGGGAAPDTVTIPIATGIPTAGELQCTVWAGDGSHRTPMMTKANETPAIDSVRITVTPNDQPVTYDAGAAKADATQQADAKQQEAGAQKPDSDPALQAATGSGAPAATSGGDNAVAPETAAATPQTAATESSEPSASATEAPPTN